MVRLPWKAFREKPPSRYPFPWIIECKLAERSLRFHSMKLHPLSRHNKSALLSASVAISFYFHDVWAQFVSHLGVDRWQAQPNSRAIPFRSRTLRREARCRWAGNSKQCLQSYTPYPNSVRVQPPIFVSFNRLSTS